MDRVVCAGIGKCNVVASQKILREPSKSGGWSLLLPSHFVFSLPGNPGTLLPPDRSARLLKDLVTLGLRDPGARASYFEEVAQREIMASRASFWET